MKKGTKKPQPKRREHQGSSSLHIANRIQRRRESKGIPEALSLSVPKEPEEHRRYEGCTREQIIEAEVARSSLVLQKRPFDRDSERDATDSLYGGWIHHVVGRLIEAGVAL